MTTGKNKITMHAGVPQGSVLRPTFWNMIYDGVLRIPLIGNAITIAFADDLALVVEARDTEELTAITNLNINKIKRWMDQIDLEIAMEKTYAVLLKGYKPWASRIKLRIGNDNIRLGRSVKYLDIYIGHGGTLGRHITKTCERADGLAVKIARIMPNIPGPKFRKIEVIASAHTLLMLFEAPIWAEVANDIARFRKMINSSQRKMLIRVASAYRTVSAKALQVIMETW